MDDYEKILRELAVVAALQESSEPLSDEVKMWICDVMLRAEKCIGRLLAR